MPDHWIATELGVISLTHENFAFKLKQAARNTAETFCFLLVILSVIGGQPVSPYLVYAVPQASRMSASALFNGQLYFSNNNNQVYAYDAISMHPNGQISIEGLNVGPEGLAINANDGILYVSDLGSNRVRWLNLSNSVYNGSWNATCPEGLSINGAGNVIVSASNAKKVIEYTPEGTLVQEIPLETNKNPRQAVEISNNTFVVTFTGQLHGVLTMTSTGQVINSYGSLAGSGAGQMNMPRCLVVDDDGFFIVADRDNNRVLVFNPSLSDVRPLPIPSSVNLVQPRSLSYDQARGRLYVGEGGGLNRMLVFDGITNIKSLFYWRAATVQFIGLRVWWEPATYPSKCSTFTLTLNVLSKCGTVYLVPSPNSL